MSRKYSLLRPLPPSLERVTIPDHVTDIEDDAFYSCDSLRFIRLSNNLEYIGKGDFYNCKSVEAGFLPPTVTYIDDEAFYDCESLRFLYAPETIDHLGDGVFQWCDRLLTTIEYNEDDNGYAINSEAVNEWLMQRHANFHLHQACSSTSVTSQEIEGSIHTHGIECATAVDDQQMTALHILCANPHVTGDYCISAIGSRSCRTARLWRNDSFPASLQEWHYSLRWQGLFFIDGMVVLVYASPDRNGHDAKAWMIIVRRNVIAANSYGEHTHYNWRIRDCKDFVGFL